MLVFGAVFNFIHEPLDQVHAHAAFFSFGDALLDIGLRVGINIEGMAAVLYGDPEMLFIAAHRNIDPPGGIKLIGVLDDIGDGFIYGKAYFLNIGTAKAVLAGMFPDEITYFGKMLG